MTRHQEGTIYLLHFDLPYHHARHYLGFTTNLEERLKRHAEGGGARLLAVIHAAGITWRLACTWPGDRDLERKMKKNGHIRRRCHICKEECECSK